MGHAHAQIESQTPKQIDHAEYPEPVDIDILIKDMERLQKLVKPFVKLGYILHRIQRWDSPQLCVLLLIIINSACLVFPTSYYLLLQLVAIGFCVSVGMSHLKYRLLSKVIPNPYIARNEEERSHSQLMHEFRDFLAKAQSLLTRMNNFLLHFYSLLKWENSTSSTRFYLLLSVMIVLANMLSLRYFLTLLLNIFFLHIPIQTFIAKKYAEKLEKKKKPVLLRKQASESAISHASLAATPNSEGDTVSLSQRSVSEPGDALEDSDMDMSEKFGNDSSDSDFSDNEDSTYDHTANDSKLKRTGSGMSAGSMGGGTRTGVMGRIIEFKKRQQQAGVGACIGCGMNFTAILKRRRTCTYCGNHYCSKCCCIKIPKTYFGATAPSAQMESVLVCHYCHQFLTAGGSAAAGEKSKPL